MLRHRERGERRDGVELRDEHGERRRGVEHVHALLVRAGAVADDLMRADHDVDARRHAEADQKRDDDDVGEVEGQTEAGRGGDGP